MRYLVSCAECGNTYNRKLSEDGCPVCGAMDWLSEVS